MKRSISVILLFLSINSHAQFSQFINITPETEKMYKFNVQVTQDQSNEDLFKVRFHSKFLSLKYPSSQHAWLILTSKTLSTEEQHFRSLIWFPENKNKDVILMSRLMPNIEHKFDSVAKTFELILHDFEVTIHKDFIKTAYIYIDYPTVVMDGGYYYSIDLGSYWKQQNKTANQRVDLTVKTPVESGNEQGTAGHP